MTTRSMGSHHHPNQGATDDWLTPPHIIEALGPFNLDPCASVDQPWQTAQVQHTVEQDGMEQAWPYNAFVWLNPPYGPDVWRWLHRLGDHHNGIALIFARTETAGFFREVWNRADSLLFLEGRLYFHHPVTGERAKANSGAPSVLVGYGPTARLRLENSGLAGAFVTDWRCP